jgi:outer membrane protein OmpA-like peptidoglycan-associated protein
MRSWYRATVIAVAATLLVGCTSGDDDASGEATADGAASSTASGDRSAFEVLSGPVGTREVASGSTSGEVRQPPRSTSVVREAGADPQSIVDVEVGEVISTYGGEVVDAGTLLTLDEPILFDFDSAELRPSAAAALQEIVGVLDFYEDAPVLVIGHTDGRGTDDYNDRLSQERADAVAEALVGYGLDDGRLEAEGRGSRDPVADETGADGNDDPEARAANLRVEILIEGVEPPT